MMGIDSGPEHVAAATETPTAVVWRGFHPYFCFDPQILEGPDEEDVVTIATNVTHCVQESNVLGDEESEKTFESLYYVHRFLAPWKLYEEDIPKMLEQAMC